MTKGKSMNSGSAQYAAGTGHEGEEGKNKQETSSNDDGGEIETKSVKEPASPPETKEMTWYQAVSSGDDDQIKKGVAAEISKMVTRYKLEDYKIVLLFDPRDSIGNYHSNALYNAVSKSARSKDVLLIIHSDGGSIEPAYLASKSLKHFSKSKFVAAVPRKAKSAATLICLGADEIHMGVTSQLGPIDPQIGGFPALGLMNALETLAGLTQKFPDAANMLSQFLQAKLDLRILGYFNRVTESAIQYAERLLAGKKLPKEAIKIADHLVNHYKDHGFVIDREEACNLLGEDVVKFDSAEYLLADEMFQFFDFLEFLLHRRGKGFWYCGDVDTGISIYELNS